MLTTLQCGKTLESSSIFYQRSMFFSWKPSESGFTSCAVFMLPTWLPTQRVLVTGTAGTFALILGRTRHLQTTYDHRRKSWNHPNKLHVEIATFMILASSSMRFWINSHVASSFARFHILSPPKELQFMQWDPQIGHIIPAMKHGQLDILVDIY